MSLPKELAASLKVLHLTYFLSTLNFKGQSIKFWAQYNFSYGVVLSSRDNSTCLDNWLEVGGSREGAQTLKPLHIPSLYEKKNSVFSWELVFVCPCPQSFSQGFCNEIPAKISS